ncbi:hypothetical protein ATO6_10990 [Oceanicola sp. 22II-s10i]|uniref:hypothetical protein n=1 Tax=Oceanicola sp. 22II-s10i TaxID=1317116 RepID=UPI000B5243E7|nr:hypothetical protein [Oceanicola sp. 22II-s10i]OWU84833.1 hypothetical protein ATO6_10990 [Oceanicola sp. 22II-s10i]
MNKLIALSVAGAALFAAPANAQSVEFSYGAAGNIAVYSGGEEYTIEAYVEGSYNGFFAGVWASTLDDGGPFDVEFDLYAGYGLTMGQVDVAATVTTYIYDDTYDSTDAELALAFAVNEMLSVGGAVAYNFDYETFDVSAGFAVTPVENFELAALVGDDGTGVYWEASAVYTFSNGFYGKILYEDNDYGGPETVTFTLGIDF